MGLARQAYNTLFRRSSTFMVTIFVGAFVFERVFDDGMDRLWERINQGKLWKHVKGNYIKEGSDDE